MDGDVVDLLAGPVQPEVVVPAADPGAHVVEVGGHAFLAAVDAFGMAGEATQLVKSPAPLGVRSRGGERGEQRDQATGEADVHSHGSPQCERHAAAPVDGGQRRATRKDQTPLMSEPLFPEHVPSRCERCGADNTMESRTVRRAFVHGERVVVVEGIPAIVCRACGAEYCDDSSALVMNVLRGDGFRADQAVTRLDVPVFRFGDHLAKGDG